MGFYKFEKEYEEKAAELIGKLSQYSQDNIRSLYLVAVTDNNDIIVQYDENCNNDMVLASSYLNMVNQSRYYAFNKREFECCCDDDDDIIGLTE